MIDHNEETGQTTITCDKCGKNETAPTSAYNQVFSISSWGLYPNAKKYFHKCRGCMSAKHRKASDWAREKFGV